MILHPYPNYQDYECTLSLTHSFSLDTWKTLSDNTLLSLLSVVHDYNQKNPIFLLVWVLEFTISCMCSSSIDCKIHRTTTRQHLYSSSCPMQPYHQHSLFFTSNNLLSLFGLQHLQLPPREILSAKLFTANPSFHSRVANIVTFVLCWVECAPHERNGCH